MPPLRTFIVEDSPVILENLVDMLEELTPVKVIGSAPDEQGAVSWLSDGQQGCDLLIIDIFLKGGSGLGVLRAAAQSGRHIKRVVLTNYATPDMRRRCDELGADRVFDKSSELENLIEYCDEIGKDDEPTPDASG
ncbi:MAG: response regulator [Burkholderiaceae bacterium]